MRASNTLRPFARSLAVAVVAGVPVGCSDGLARVEGEVTLDGESVVQTDVRRAYVNFKPVGGGPGASGSVDESGRFRLSIGSQQAVPPGDYRASVRVCDVTPPSGPGGYSASKTVSPERYANSTTSDLRFQLKAGSNDITIPLASDPPQ